MGNSEEFDMVSGDTGVVPDGANAVLNPTPGGYARLASLIIKKSRNNNEYKKYSELSSMLMLDYYKRLGSIDDAEQTVYMLVENAKDINELANHYKALQLEEKNGNGDTAGEHARARIINTLFNDYKKRFGPKNAEAYSVLVLQGWTSKIETTNELAILMDNILTIREKIGNSWDYEVHVVPLLMEKAFSAETLIDYANAMTNFVIGLTRKLKDNYLAIMTAVKVLEISDSPKTIKHYIREMVRDLNKRLDALNGEFAMMNSNPMLSIVNYVRKKELEQKIKALEQQVDELMEGIDPKEFMLENTKR
ncbi:MAG: hypothetical protein ACP5MK_01725 [Candidatus Micrarchaeia archaeon]